VHASTQRSRREGWFEVIAGKSMPAEGEAKCFGFVQTYDPKPKRRLFEVLKAQGMQPNQQVTFLTDGGEDVRELPLYLNPQAEHLIDWFHITMRLTVMGQMTKGLEAETGTRVAKELERLKWFLWRANVLRALQVIEDLEMESTSREPLQRSASFTGRWWSSAATSGPTPLGSRTMLSVTAVARRSRTRSWSRRSTRS
jgi:hypothetical protein